jgi:hypothetical protein
LSEDSWLSPTVLAKLKGQQDKAAQECVLLLGNSPPEQPPSAREEHHPLDNVPAAGDGPDDLHVEAPPEQTEAWWSRLLFNPDDTPVSPQEAVLALQYVTYRLGLRRSEIPTLSSAITVGELHTTIKELYGAQGWTALVLLWQAAAGITRPARVHASIPNRIPVQKVTHGLPLSPSPSLENETRALRELPGAVRRFWLHEPPLRPWRYSATGSEKEWRVDQEGDGAWAG